MYITFETSAATFCLNVFDDLPFLQQHWEFQLNNYQVIICFSDGVYIFQFTPSNLINNIFMICAFPEGFVEDRVAPEET